MIRLAKPAKRDGLTLTRSMNILREKLERAEQEIARASERDFRTDDSSVQQLRLEAEALALLFMAVHQAYPARADK